LLALAERTRKVVIPLVTNTTNTINGMYILALPFSDEIVSDPYSVGVEQEYPALNRAAISEGCVSSDVLICGGIPEAFSGWIVDGHKGTSQQFHYNKTRLICQINL
jgi:hypothetical protein